jgi:2'-5' RNA ligase
MQGSLDLGDNPPKRLPRLYFCLLMGPAAEAILEDLRLRLARCVAGWVWTAVGRRHLSLHFLRACARPPARIVHAAEEAARGLATRPFDIVCRDVVCIRTPGNGPDPFRLILRTESPALTALHDELGARMANCRLRPAAGLTPHITLGRGAMALPEQAIEPIRIAVRDVALVLSGRDFDVLRRFPLRA